VMNIPAGSKTTGVRLPPRWPIVAKAHCQDRPCRPK
jgi:hypothetical protein